MTRKLAVASIVGFFTLCSNLTALPVTFAQYTQQLGGNDFVWTNSGTGNSTLTGTTQINFTFLNVPGLQLALQGPQSATLTINANTTLAGSTIGPFLLQPMSGGTITITRNAPVDGMTNLLTAVFTNGNLSGEAGGTGATLSSSTPPFNQVTFSSDFLDFSAVNISKALSLSFTSVTPPLSLGAASQIASFVAAGTGTFSSEPVPSRIPEPTTMALAAGALGLIALARKRAA